MSSKKIILALCLALMSITSASAKSWRGIEPLHSTRADVERLLGPPTDDKPSHMPRYDFPEERAIIHFSSGEPCEEGLPGGWKVAKDIVLRIDIYPRVEKKMAEVLVAGKEYKQIRGAHTQHVYYIDSDEGITFTIWENLVQSMTYGPSAKDRKQDYQCTEYKYAAPIAPGAKLQAVEHARFDHFGDLHFDDAQARLDNFVIQLFQLRETEPSWRGYIIVYAGHRSYLGEAQFKANCYKNYLVRARKLAPGSLFAVDGGFRDEFQVDLYIGRADHYPPVLFPTVSPKKVQVLKRRLRSCNERSSVRR